MVYNSSMMIAKVHKTDLERFLDERGLKHVRLAKRLGVPNTTLHKYIKGVLPVDKSMQDRITDAVNGLLVGPVKREELFPEPSK